GSLVDELDGVGAEPAEEREVVPPSEHVHGVDLEQSDVLQDPPQRVAVRTARPAVGEPLRSERDPARLGGGEPLPAISGHRRTIRNGRLRGAEALPTRSNAVSSRRYRPGRRPRA